MDTLTKPEIDSLEETEKLTPMIVCGCFASAIMKIADKLINRNLTKGWEINSEPLSEELRLYVPLQLNKIENFKGYSPKDMSYCCDPKIEGGDYYNVYLKKNYKWEDFGFDVFKYSVGVKMNDYCCYLIRSRGFRSTGHLKANYAFMMSVHEEVLRKLKDGIALCEVYKAAQTFAEGMNPNLAKHLEKDFGFQLGPDFKKDSVAIDSNTKIIARKDMFFAVKVNLIGLKEQKTEYSLCHCDTVVVRKDQPSRILTFFKASSANITPSKYTENTVKSDLTEMTTADKKTSVETSISPKRR